MTGDIGALHTMPSDVAPPGSEFHIPSDSYNNVAPTVLRVWAGLGPCDIGPWSYRKITPVDFEVYLFE